MTLGQIRCVTVFKNRKEVDDEISKSKCRCSVSGRCSFICRVRAVDHDGTGGSIRGAIQGGSESIWAGNRNTGEEDEGRAKCSARKTDAANQPSKKADVLAEDSAVHADSINAEGKERSCFRR